MEDLKDLARIIDRESYAVHKYLPLTFTKSPQLGELFHLLFSGKAENDQTAIQALYPLSRSKRNFNELKKRLKDRLLDCLFFIYPLNSRFTDIERAFFSCSRLYLASRLLSIHSSYRLSEKILNQAIRKALKFEFTEIVLLCAKRLVGEQSALGHSPKKQKYYIDLLKSAEFNLRAETAAETAYFSLIALHGTTQETIDDVLLNELYTEHIQRLKEFETIDTARFVRMNYMFRIAYYELSNQPEDGIRLCKEAIEYFDEKPYKSKGVYYSFGLRLLSTTIKTGRYEEGFAIVRQYQNTCVNNSPEWYLMNYYHFILTCHSRSYDQSKEILLMVYKAIKLDRLYEKLRQLWLINEAYVHLFIQCGKVELEPGDKDKLRPFRLYKFLNDVPIYSKDKRGINVSILIIHVLFLLSKGKHVEAHDRIYALTRYNRKYLRRDDTFRSSCFIRMLNQLSRAQFNRKRAERYAAKYVKALATMPLSHTRQGIETEVVPYEHLWEMVLEMAD